MHRKEDFHMNDFTTEILKTLANKGDLNELFRVHLEKAVNTLLKTELTAFLDYEKYDRIGFNTGNSRNGSYDRTVKTEYGELHLQIPRDRNGEFKQQTVPAYRRMNDTLEETVIHLFRKGITMSEIADLIEKMYGHHYTPQTMSNMTKSFTEEVTSFKERELHDRYAAIYMDATYIPLKRKTVAKEAIHIAVGIRPDGSKEVLSYAIAPTESITIWEEILIDLQERGVKNVLLFITDGLKGMAGAVQRFYPKARFQHCCVHVSRNISHKVRVDDRKEVCDDFKMVESILSNDYLLTFYDFPLAIRKSIYSTNLIESFNKQIKKYSHRKEQFQNEESMERFLVSSFDTYNQKFLGRSHKGFQQAEGELEQMLSQPMEN
ncbi:IS256 family transposase [Enterococcus sp. C60(2024)]